VQVSVKLKKRTRKEPNGELDNGDGDDLNNIERKRIRYRVQPKKDLGKARDSRNR